MNPIGINRNAILEKFKFSENSEVNDDTFSLERKIKQGIDVKHNFKNSQN